MSAANQPPAKKPSVASTNGSTTAAKRVRRSKAEILASVRELYDQATVPSVIASRLSLTKAQVRKFLDELDSLAGAERMFPIVTKNSGDVKLEKVPIGTAPNPNWHDLSLLQVREWLAKGFEAEMELLDQRVSELEDRAKLSPLSETQMRTVLELAARVAREAAASFQIIA